MANTHPRTPGDPGVSLYLLSSFLSAAVVPLVLLLTAVIAHAQTLTFRNPRDLLIAEPAALFALLESARPAPVSSEDMSAILRVLPPEGEVTNLEPVAQQKLAAVRQLLTTTRRDWYEIKVIDVPQAVVALHARAVVLISAPAVALVDTAELQALAAHEIGHEYVWTEWHRAHERAGQQHLKALELVCDAIAMVTLRQLGMDPSRVIDGLEKVGRFNRERFGAATNEENYPTLAERRAFARQIQRWLRDSSERSPVPEGPSVLLRMPNHGTVSERGSLGPRTTSAVAQNAPSGPPHNLQAGVYRSVVHQMWRDSPGFRRQCTILATEPALTVRLRGESRPSPSGVRARSEISVKRGRVSFAEIVLMSPADTVELIAHEIEHVIEAMEGVRLTEQGCSSMAHARESCRAIEAGRRIAAEVHAARQQQRIP